MNSNQSTPASAVAALQQEIRTRTEVIRTLADLREQLDADRICGSWLSAENNLSASIRRIGEGTWRILVLDHTLCSQGWINHRMRTANSKLIISEIQESIFP